LHCEKNDVPYERLPSKGTWGGLIVSIDVSRKGMDKIGLAKKRKEVERLSIFYEKKTLRKEVGHKAQGG